MKTVFINESSKYTRHSFFAFLSICRSETRPPEDDEEEEEEILGSDDDEQEDPKDYVKGML